MTGALSVTLGIPKNLTDITLPDTVYNSLKQSASYTFDATPDIFSFERKISVTPGNQVSFGPVTLTGFNMPVSAAITRGTLDVNGVLYGTGTAVVKPGDVITIYMYAPSSYNSSASGTLSIGLIRVNYEVETSLAVTIPPIGPGGGGG